MMLTQDQVQLLPTTAPVTLDKPPRRFLGKFYAACPLLGHLQLL